MFLSGILALSSAFISPLIATHSSSTSSSRTSMSMERTYIMIKPDGVQRRLVGDIVKRFESKGFQVFSSFCLQYDFCNIIHNTVEGFETYTTRERNS